MPTSNRSASPCPKAFEIDQTHLGNLCSKGEARIQTMRRAPADRDRQGPKTPACSIGRSKVRPTPSPAFGGLPHIRLRPRRPGERSCPKGENGGPSATANLRNRSGRSSPMPPIGHFPPHPSTAASRAISPVPVPFAVHRSSATIEYQRPERQVVDKKGWQRRPAARREPKKAKAPPPARPSP